MIVTGNLDASPTVIGVDAQTLYFSTYDSPPYSSAFSITKTALSGPATSISTGLNASFSGVIGNTPFYSVFQGFEGSCTIGECSSTENALPSPQRLIPFSSPSPQYFSEYDLTTTPSATMSISWYTTGNTLNATYSEPTDSITSYSSFFAYGDSVYWISYYTDTGGVFHSLGLYTTSRTGLSKAQLAGSLTQNMSIV